MKVWFRRNRPLFYALFPVPYLAAEGILFLMIKVMERYLNWDGLIWQCAGALLLTLFVLGPVCFVCTGIACVCHSAEKLRRREEVRKHVILLLIGLITVCASAAFFWWYWYA